MSDQHSAGSEDSISDLSERECPSCGKPRLTSGADEWRYAACGNGVVANVSEWIGRRIMTIEEEKNV